LQNGYSLTGTDTREISSPVNSAIESAPRYAGDTDTADGDDVEGQFAKSMEGMLVLSKSETASPEMRERAGQLHRRMQAQHLLRVNPSAAAEWAELHAA